MVNRDAVVVEQAPDYPPIIDILDWPSNYVVVTASAHGFGISLATDKFVSDLVLRDETNIDISGLGLGRLADVKPGCRQQRGARRSEESDCSDRKQNYRPILVQGSET